MKVFFSDVSLVVFDECHILHPRTINDSKRSLDSMICLLKILEESPGTNIFLSSAMVENSNELSSWISDSFNKEVITLDSKWKPTRQIRGCVVYDQTRVSELETYLENKRDEVSEIRRSPNNDDKEALTVSVNCIFSLKNRWDNNGSDYTKLPLLNEPVTIGSNPNWRLTSNKNKVASKIAAKFARNKSKTIIFSQNKEHCVSIARDSGNLLANDTEFNYSQDEEDLKNRAVDEIGNESAVYLPFSNKAVAHHGLMIQEEKLLNESLFRRDSGVDVIAATPTLAHKV